MLFLLVWSERRCVHDEFLLSLVEELVWEVLLTEFVLNWLFLYTAFNYANVVVDSSRPSYQCSHV